MDMLETLKRRSSIRAYTSEPLQENIIKFLNAEISMINAHEAGMHISLVTDSPDAFNGMKRSYGMFRGVRNYIAFVVEPSFPHTYERAGFFAEQLAIKCVELGLGTCFVGGTFSRKDVPVVMRAGYTLPFVLTIGYAEIKPFTPVSKILASYIHRNKKKSEDFFIKKDIDLQEALQEFPKLQDGLEALMCAPSALNKQPVRISIVKSNDEYYLEAFVEKPQDSLLIDLGIAKFNISVAMNISFEWGNNGKALLDSL